MARDMVVVGASAGGTAALVDFVKTLPRDFPAAIFVVVHIPSHSPSQLPEILNRCGPLPARHPSDGEPIRFGQIYVAQPDRHLLVEGNHILVKNGPKENRFRPSVDALFRSAAYVFGPRVIGIVLSGALNDGTSGLWSIKRRGGLAIVQDPRDAIFNDMPSNALAHVEIDHTVPISAMGPLLAKLVFQEDSGFTQLEEKEQRRLEMEVCIATRDNAFEMGIMEMGELSPFTCPECHGALVRFSEGNLVRFRCHTGHAYTASALLAGITEGNEEKLWQAMRGFEESVMLLQHLGDHFAEIKEDPTAQLFYQKAKESKARARIIHDSVLGSESLSEDLRWK